MTMNPHPSFFDRLFGPGNQATWDQRAAWETQKATWKAQRYAQRSAWKAQRHADRWRCRGPFAALGSVVWTVFWVGFGLLLMISPEFRSRVMHFVVAIPQFIVHVLYEVAGRSEI